MDRFWNKVDKTSNDCWQWLASDNGKGYGRFVIDGKSYGAHRLSYTWLVGEIPPGMVIDHHCRNHGCVNPSHLEPTTAAENSRRGIAGKVCRERQLSKDHCPKGHSYSGDNLYVRPDGKGRDCKACKLEAAARHRLKKRNQS